MDTFSIRILLAEDYEPWRRLFRSTFQKQAELQVVCEVSDGLEAVRKAEELQPDLILLDIGLPKLNGIEAARQIRNRAPNSKILFLSEHRSSDIAGEVLRTGASGYVVKSDVATDLLRCVKAVREGKQFVSASLAVRRTADGSPPDDLGKLQKRDPDAKILEDEE